LRSFEADHTDVAKLDQIAAILGVREPPLRMDSQAKSLLLAAGEGELIFRLLSPRRPDYTERIWDQAAGALLVEEAGGRVTDLAGEALDFRAGRTLERNIGVLASNGWLHEAALEAIRQAGADRRPVT
jgi:3'(2'), 5'-bisphosphate nucleotidase